MNPIIEQLRAEVARNKTVDGSAVVLLNGIESRIQKAVDKALENGATAAELEPLTTELAALKASNDELSAAITANTPAAEPAEAGAAGNVTNAPRTGRVAPGNPSTTTPA